MTSSFSVDEVSDDKDAVLVVFASLDVEVSLAVDSLLIAETSLVVDSILVAETSLVVDNPVVSAQLATTHCSAISTADNVNTPALLILCKPFFLVLLLSIS